jgi:hypothetical protein
VHHTLQSARCRRHMGGELRVLQSRPPADLGCTPCCWHHGTQTPLSPLPLHPHPPAPAHPHRTQLWRHSGQVPGLGAQGGAAHAAGPEVAQPGNDEVRLGILGNGDGIQVQAAVDDILLARGGGGGPGRG